MFATDAGNGSRHSALGGTCQRLTGLQPVDSIFPGDPFCWQSDDTVHDRTLAGKAVGNQRLAGLLSWPFQNCLPSVAPMAQPAYFARLHFFLLPAHHIVGDEFVAVFKRAVGGCDCTVELL